MKLSQFVSLLLVAVVAVGAAAGCKKKPVGVTPIGARTGGGAPVDPDAGRALPADGNTAPESKPDDGLAQTAPGTYDTYNKNAEMFKEDMVFFAYDSSVVRASEKAKVAKIAAYMTANPTHAMEVDGHCDERGTEEYNRALGERRALSVRSELAALGADPNKIITKTFGKDRPLVPLSGEAAWSKNRRAEFIVLTPP